jgi:hypothetical protein
MILGIGILQEPRELSRRESSSISVDNKDNR